MRFRTQSGTTYELTREGMLFRRWKFVRGEKFEQTGRLLAWPVVSKGMRVCISVHLDKNTPMQDRGFFVTSEVVEVEHGDSAASLVSAAGA